MLFQHDSRARFRIHHHPRVRPGDGAYSNIATTAVTPMSTAEIDHAPPARRIGAEGRDRKLLLWYEFPASELTAKTRIAGEHARFQDAIIAIPSPHPPDHPLQPDSLGGI